MINLVLITGFLGAGKTTLMQETLNLFADKKIAVIVNEFGSVNIDAVLIKRDGIQMAELSNGSIFCACIKDKFVDSLIEMSSRNLDYVFIEASGLADPSNMAQILQGIEHKLLNKYEYKGSICVVDGEYFLELFDLLPAIRYQVEYSSVAIINKGDLINEEQLKNILYKIQEVNPQLQTYITSYCRVNIRQIIDTMESVFAGNMESRETSNTYSSRPSTFIIKGRGKVAYNKLEAFISELAVDAYRIKGFASTERGNIEVSTVGKHIKLVPWNGEIDNIEIVVISAVGFKMMSRITRAIEHHVKGVLSI